MNTGLIKLYIFPSPSIISFHNARLEMEGELDTLSLSILTELTGNFDVMVAQLNTIYHT